MGEVGGAAGSGGRKGQARGGTGERARGRLALALVLVLNAPAVAEVLFGATPVTNLGAPLPDVAVYGCGALLIRGLVRRRGLGWSLILALGVAFGIVEEDLTLGSLFNPNLFDAGNLGGRAPGIN